MVTDSIENDMNVGYINGLFVHSLLAGRENYQESYQQLYSADFVKRKSILLNYSEVLSLAPLIR